MLFVYDASDYTEYEDLILSLELMQKTNWLNLHGLNEMEIIEAIGDF
jgi:magnesium transporter